MKKYFLTALLWVFGLFGAFASASSFTFECPNDWFSSCYIPNSIIFSDSTRLDFSSFTNFECDDYCTFDIVNNDDDNYISCEFWFDWDQSFLFWYNIDSLEGYCILDAWTYEVNHSDWSYFTSITVNYWDNSWDSSWIILPWWEGSLSWIISWLNSTITEFIPYLVYLGLWIITVIIWFVAIRWLVNWTQAKIRWTFSSWRRRR